MEKIVVEMDRERFSNLLFWANEYMDVNYKANEDYIIKEVKIEDDFFKDDATHKELKSQSNKAYKALKNYEFDKRNG